MESSSVRQRAAVAAALLSYGGEERVCVCEGQNEERGAHESTERALLLRNLTFGGSVRACLKSATVVLVILSERAHTHVGKARGAAGTGRQKQRIKIKKKRRGKARAREGGGAVAPR